MESSIKNIKEVTEPLKEEILNGHVHTIDEMKTGLQPLGYSETINELAIKFILREFVMRVFTTDNIMIPHPCNSGMNPVTKMMG